MVRGAACDCWRGPVKSQGGQLEFVYKCVDYPDGIVFGDEVFETFRQQRCLIAVRTFDKSPHLRLAH
ncbi:hypothetical protein FEP08_05873 [Burkholderia multivorans]|nr:hypothetical protein [Burkholderia multivorans]